MNKVENELRKYAEFVTPKHIAEVMLAGAEEIARLEAQNDLWVDTCDKIIQAKAEGWWNDAAD